MPLNSIVKGSNLNRITDAAIRLILNDGMSNESRNGEVTYLNNVIVELEDPKARHLALKGRKNNLYATIAELFWVMSGDDKIDPFLSFFLPRAKDYSDNGVTWRGAYGPRIYMDDQLQNAIDVFKTDGLNTRRSVISIYDSFRDSGEDSKDIPCNNFIHFYALSGKLNMNVLSRSSDLLWGLFGINIPEWTFLQEYVAQQVGLPVGTYTHFTTNLHIYSSTRSQAQSVYSTVQDTQPLWTYTSVFPTTNVRRFFEELVSVYERMMNGGNSHYNAIEEIDNIFIGYKTTIYGNNLYHYARLLASYVSQKLGYNDPDCNNPLEQFSPDLSRAVFSSSFTKFRGVKHGRVVLRGSV